MVGQVVRARGRQLRGALERVGEPVCRPDPHRSGRRRCPGEHVDGRRVRAAARVRPAVARAAAGRASTRSRSCAGAALLRRADHGVHRGRRARCGPRRSSPACSTRRSSRREFGIAKPDPQIYLALREALGVEPGEAAASSATAPTTSWPARSGSACVRCSSTGPASHRCGREVQTWDGPRVTSIPEVLEVLELC